MERQEFGKTFGSEKSTFGSGAAESFYMGSFGNGFDSFNSNDQNGRKPRFGTGGFSSSKNTFPGDNAENANPTSGGFGNHGFAGERNIKESFRSSNESGNFSQGSTQPRQQREGNGNRNCYNCDQPGHTARECQEERKPRRDDGRRGFGGNGRNDGTNFTNNSNFGAKNFGIRGTSSGEFGSSQGGFGGNENPRGPIKCYSCNEEGHRSSDCNAPRKGCYNCGEQGHNSKDCSSPRKQNEDGRPPATTFVPVEEDVENIFNLQKITEGIMFEKFFEADVEVTSGTRKVSVKPVKSFAQAGLTEKLLLNVKHAGYSKTTPIQQYSIPLIKDGIDIIACAQTGSGKTAAFLLPIMTTLINDDDLNTVGECGCYPRCLILTPTRELADQIHNEGRKFAFQTMVEIKPVYGGISVQYNKTSIERGATFLVGTVGRVKHFIQEGIIKLNKLRYIVLDEADRMIDAMSFGPDIEIILSSAGMPPKENIQSLMFSATFPNSVQLAARALLKPDYAMITIDKIGAANKCVVQEFVQISKPEKKEKLLELLGVDLDTYTTEKSADVYSKKTIVFVSQRAMADTLAATLSQSNIPSITIHGAREQRERSEALRLFRNGKKPVLIATAVAERGLDIKGVDHVINYDLPQHLDDYIHRIGRTGRVGNSGRATSFFTNDDIGLVDGLLQVLADAQQNVPNWMLAMSTRGTSAFKSFGAEVQPEDAW